MFLIFPYSVDGFKTKSESKHKVTGKKVSKEKWCYCFNEKQMKKRNAW